MRIASFTPPRPTFAGQRPTVNEINDALTKGEVVWALYHQGEAAQASNNWLAFDLNAEGMLDSGNPYFQQVAREEIAARGRQDQFKKPRRV